MMGFDPEQTGRMSLWQYNRCIEAWVDGHEGKDALPEPPSRDQFRRFMDAPVGGYRAH